jgi:hypothetical protein
MIIHCVPSVDTGDYPPVTSLCTPPNTQYSEASYLKEAGDSVYRIREYLREFVNMERIRWFRVLIPHRMIGML